MQKMTLEATQNLVNSYVKSFGQSGAAQKLNEQGYRSPMCATILQAHICRIMNGSSTCLLAPETEDQQQEPPITKEPIAAAPKRRREIEKILASEELLQKEIAKTAAEIEQELIAEQAAIEEMERSLPPLVPLIESRPHREARHMEKAARVNAIFDRRSEVKLDEDRYFFGIPCLRHKPVTNSRPYQQRRYGQNVLSTRDLSVHQK